MARFILGIALILHGLAHGLPGMLASEGHPPVWRIVLVTVAWTVAVGGYFSAGLGVWGTALFRPWWRLAIYGASLASFGLFLMAGRVSLWPGLLIDVVFLGFAFSNPDWLEQRAGVRMIAPHKGWSGFWSVLGTLSLLYVSLAVALRPWHHNWGTSLVERETPFIGDELAPNRLQSINHSITINAPAERVWPWIVQMGQDKGGFYSYDWLERLFGDDIHNAERVVPGYQDLKEGDLVRAAQPDYMGGRLGDQIGWRVAKIVPNRALVLQNWGSFVLVPEGTNRTRLIIRTHFDTGPIWAAPIGVFLFEPVHFIMEQKMLRTIKEQVEKAPAAI